MENSVVSEPGAEKKCALCGLLLHLHSSVSLCPDCIKYADCCIGLEQPDN